MYLLIYILIFVALFLLGRNFILWYFKIDIRLEEQKKLNNKLDHLIEILEDHIYEDEDEE